MRPSLLAAAAWLGLLTTPAGAEAPFAGAAAGPAAGPSVSSSVGPPSGLPAVSPAVSPILSPVVSPAVPGVEDADRAVAAPADRHVAMSDPDLAGVRGGLMTPLGVEVGFAAAMHTYVDGRLVLETHLAWTPDGLVQSQSGPLAATSEASGWSLALNGPAGGETQVLQSARGGQLLSVITNTADNRNIRQDTDIVLTLPQLADLQRQVGAQHISSMLQGALNAALQGGAGR